MPVTHKTYNGSSFTSLCDSILNIKDSANNYQEIDVSDNTKRIQVYDGIQWQTISCPSDDPILANVRMSIYFCYSDYDTNGFTCEYSVTNDAGWTLQGITRIIIYDNGDDSELATVYDSIAILPTSFSLSGITDFTTSPFYIKFIVTLTDISLATRTFRVNFGVLPKALSSPEGGPANFRCTIHYINQVMEEVV